MEKVDAVGKHILGCSLLLLAVSALLLFPLLPGGSQKALDLPIFAKTDKDLLVAYIGYPSCHTTCPVSLKRLQTVYQAPNATPQFDVMVINVQLDMAEAIGQSYARAYHPDFLSHSITSDERDDFHQQLGIRTYYTAESASQHPGNIYVFKRVKQQWLLHRMYPSLPDSEQIITDLKTITT